MTQAKALSERNEEELETIPSLERCLKERMFLKSIAKFCNVSVPMFAWFG